MAIRRTAQWRDGPEERVRVLIEDPRAEWFEEFGRYRSAGLEVAACTGPGTRGVDCPHLEGGRCELWASADVVVFALPDDDPAGRAVLEAARRQYPGKPIVYDRSIGSAPDAAEAPGGSAAARVPAILSAIGRR